MRKLESAAAALAVCVFAISMNVTAGPREQAKRIHDRLAGVPPSAEVLEQMRVDVAAGNADRAAQTAMNNRHFYSVTLKNWITPWTNEEQTVFAPLNDYTATVIGIIRDDLAYDQILYANILYVGADANLPAYSNNSNAHYAAIESQDLDISDPQVLIQRRQTEVTGLADAATAGVMTTRAAAKAFLVAGTNRAMLRFTFLNHLCTDLEQIKDASIPPDRIRQDVSRSPGGDSRVFLNNCVACHAGMDPLTQAYAYYDYAYDPDSDPLALDGSIEYTANVVHPKNLINADNFSHGYVTRDDRWDNYWRQGQNRGLGWSAALPGFGNGAKSLGRELAASEAFARCQVRKAFKVACLREPANAADRRQIDAMTMNFRSSNYQMKQVFAEAATYCMGD